MSEQTPNVYVRYPEGSRAWTIHDVDGLKPCTTCDASGEVTIGDRDFDCPDCHGNGGTEYPLDEHPQLPVPIEVNYTTVYANGRVQYNITRVTREGEFVSCLGYRYEMSMFDTEEETVAAADAINRGNNSAQGRHDFFKARTLSPPGEPNVYVPFPPGSRVLFVTTDWWPRPCPTCEGRRRVTVKETEYECPDCHGRGVERNTEEHYYLGPMAALPASVLPASVLAVEIRRGANRYELNVDGMADAAKEIIGDNYESRHYGEQNDIPECFLYAEADAEAAAQTVARANEYRAKTKLEDKQC